MDHRGSLAQRFSGLAIVAGLFVLFLLALNSAGQDIDPQTTRSTQHQASPTPTPTDKGKDFFRKVREDQEATLNEHGPQPGTTSQTGSFSMLSFIRAGWPLVVEYELEEGAVADLEIVTLNDRGFHRFKHRLEGANIGEGARRDIITVPGEFGELQPGTIGISARMKTPNGSRKADFKLHGVGVGVHTLHSAEGPRRNPREAQSQSFSFINSKFEMTFPQESVLQDLVVTPQVIDTSQGQRASYTFRPAQTFGQWAADFSTVTKTVDGDGVNVTKTKRINTKEFRSEISGGSVVSGDWDGKNAKGKLSKGLHKLAIRAWWSAASAGAGASCYRNSNQEFTVQ